MLVRLFGEDMHVNEEPLPGRSFLASPKGGVQVILPTVVMQR
jgi:hypothetical protein